MIVDERSERMNLTDVPVGGTACVASIRGTGSLRGRIMAMGLVPGTVVQVVRKAPMGDPLELSVKGYYLSLRKREAEMVLVTADPIGRDGGGEDDG
jgi:ferrous iron transport protein A